VGFACAIEMGLDLRMAGWGGWSNTGSGAAVRSGAGGGTVGIGLGFLVAITAGLTADGLMSELAGGVGGATIGIGGAWVNVTASQPTRAAPATRKPKCSGFMFTRFRY